MEDNKNQINKLEAFLAEESELSASLDKSLQQVKEGKVTPHSEVRKKYKKWIEK